MPLSTIFKLYRGGQRIPLTCRMSLINFITCCIKYTLPWMGFKLTTLLLVVALIAHWIRYAMLEHTFKICTTQNNLNKMRFLLYLFFFCDTLTSNNILFGVMSCNLSFIIDHPIASKAVKYIDKSHNSSLHILNFYTLRFSRLSWKYEPWLDPIQDVIRY
jgi:hypothetical protein